MSISSRIHDTIEVWVVEWRDRLRGWFLRSIGEGILKGFEDMEPGAIEAYQSGLQKLIDNPHIPPELKEFYQKALTPGNPFSVFSGIITMILGSFGALLGGSVPIGNFMRYDQDRILHSSRLDPITAINLYRRFRDKYPNVFLDLDDQGWDKSRIDALLDATLFYPAPVDLVRWQAREVFEPEMIARYGLDSEFAAIDKEPFYKAGMTDEQILNYWRAHWEHASWMQVVEMLHRDLMTEEQVRDWFRVVEIPPFWRQLLIDSAYTWPTRVDVRRWWDMRTIDETELRRLYSGMGYRGVNLDNYVLWTKVYVAFPDLIARWSKGWITLDDVRRELIALGMPAERVEEMIQTKVKPQGQARVEEGKALTKTEIYKGVKKGIISWEQGIELLMDIDYDYEEADYILTINVEALAGSPETFEEFKNITTKYKIAAGREAKPMPEELKKAAEELARVTKEVEDLELAIKEEEDKLVDEEVLPKKATAKRDKLRVTLNRAIAEQARVQSEYDKQVAEWKHGLP